MSKHSHPKQEPQLRLMIAQTAARLMLESGIRDFAQAKRKAAAQHGVSHSRNLPGNEEIEQALMEYQRLFLGDSQPQLLHQLRQTALDAMNMLGDFDPCLVGPVLSGTADAHSAIYLHLFAETPEQVLFFLMDRRIPYEQGERQVHLAGGRTCSYPKFSFLAGDTPIELTVYPIDGKRQIPLSPVDGKPMKRADRAQLIHLLEKHDHTAG